MVTAYSYGIPYHLATCKYADTNIFIMPDALLHVAFATNVLQLMLTYVDCRQRSCISFQHFDQTHMDALDLSMKNTSGLLNCLYEACINSLDGGIL